MANRQTTWTFLSLTLALLAFYPQQLSAQQRESDAGSAPPVRRDDAAQRGRSSASDVRSYQQDRPVTRDAGAQRDRPVRDAAPQRDRPVTRDAAPQRDRPVARDYSGQRDRPVVRDAATTRRTYTPAVTTQGGQPIEIHIHHHGTPTIPWVTSQSDYPPGFDRYSGRGNTMTADGRRLNWGNMGFYGYLGKQGPHSGLIVTRVMPHSPAQQLGLVPGDYILSINDQAVDSYQQLEKQFVGINTRPEANIKMRVWNSFTNRKATLSAKLIEDTSNEAEPVRN